jgi:hypothetical protein
VYGYIDLIAAIVFIVSYMWLRMFERTEASAVDRLSITISDYTVQVSRIPEVSLSPFCPSVWLYFCDCLLAASAKLGRHL